MAAGKDICHRGTVVAVSQEAVEVAIRAVSACAACKARSVCGMDEARETAIVIATPHATAYSVGEEVEVSIKQAMGLKAVLYVYILPFILVLASLVALVQSGVSELTAGLGALGVLVFYYFLLYLFRGRLEKEIIFGIGKISGEI